MITNENLTQQNISDARTKYFIRSIPQRNVLARYYQLMPLLTLILPQININYLQFIPYKHSTLTLYIPFYFLLRVSVIRVAYHQLEKCSYRRKSAAEEDSPSQSIC
jgi:hypothetical protein